MTALNQHRMEHVLSSADALPFVQADSAPLDQSSFLNLPAYRADAGALSNPRALFWSDGADPCAIAEWARQFIRYPIVEPIYHYRVFTPDFSRFGIVIVHNATGAGDAELLAFASPGLCWTRPGVSHLARWMFWQLDLRRVTARIRSDDLRSRDFARRLGFRHEGTARRWFADDVDASLWGMLREECPWLHAFQGGRA